MLIDSSLVLLSSSWTAKDLMTTLLVPYAERRIGFVFGFKSLNRVGLSGSVSEEKRSEQVSEAVVAMEGGNAGRFSE